MSEPIKVRRGAIATIPDDIITDLATKLGLNNALSHEFLRHQLENTILFDGKQSDYGPRNISKFGAPGVLIRMSDKFERLCTLTKSKRRARNEPILDSYRDIANYAVIALMCEKGEWPQ